MNQLKEPQQTTEREQLLERALMDCLPVIDDAIGDANTKAEESAKSGSQEYVEKWLRVRNSFISQSLHIKRLLGLA